MEVGLVVLSELLLFAVISPLLEADLARPWADTLIATDASPVFGFGVSALTVPPSQARRIARHAFRPEGLVVTEEIRLQEIRLQVSNVSALAPAGNLSVHYVYSVHPLRV